MDESVGGIEQFIGHSIPDLAATAAAPVVLVALLFVFDWRFGVATLAAVAVACVVQFSGYADKRVMASMGRYQEVKEQMGNAAVEYVRGMRVVKAFGQTARSFKRLTDAIKDYTGLSLDVTLFFRNSMPGFTAIINNAYLFVLPVGILLAPGAQDWPTFVLSLVFYLLFVHSISSVFAKILYVSEDGMLAQANIDRIDSVLGIEELSCPEAPKTPKDASVSLRDVTFSYEDDAEPALRDVSLEIPAGTVCAVVGPSGSGKSTLANLVARFWDVDSGQVLVGGVDVREMSQDELMGSLSLVFQDSHLFRESIADNIRRGRPGATDDEVVEAAKAAQADGFISSLPHGYATVIGSEGVHLSGGEQQRIAIARSIISDAPIVVLDEATAFSDPENEHLIQKAFERLMAGKTVIMIAHRLSTVVGADKIVVLDGGRKVEEGTHEELLAASGTYAKMWSQYTEAVEWGIESAPGGDEARSSEAVAPHAAQDASAGEHDPAEKPGKPSNGRAPWLQRAFNLSGEGYAGLKRSALACTLSDLALMIPFVCTVAAFAALVGAACGRAVRRRRALGDLRRGACGDGGGLRHLEERLQENLRGRVHRVRKHPPAPRRPSEETAHELLQPPGHDRRGRPHHGGRDGAGVHAVFDAPAAHRRNRVDHGHLRDARLLRLAARLLRDNHAAAFGGGHRLEPTPSVAPFRKAEPRPPGCAGARAGLPRRHQGHKGLQGGGQGLRRHGAGDARAQEGDDAGRARCRRLRLPCERHPSLGGGPDRLHRRDASHLRRR